MTLQRVKISLSLVWLVAGGVLFLLLMERSLRGVFGADAQKIWGWASLHIFPPLTLIIGVWSVEKSPNDDNPASLGFVFWLAVGLSLLYLVALYFVVIYAPISGQSWEQAYGQSSLFLGPLQAIVIGFLGKFFVQSAR